MRLKQEVSRYVSLTCSIWLAMRKSKWRSQLEIGRCLLVTDHIVIWLSLCERHCFET
jgi:hypothetical protein